MKEVLITMFEHPFASLIVLGTITHGLAEIIHGPKITKPVINVTSVPKTES